MEGTTDPVGEASVDQTINIVENLVMAVEEGNQIIIGSSASTVSLGINPMQPGPGPIIVDIFSENYPLVSTEKADPQITSAMDHLNNFWVDEEKEN